MININAFGSCANDYAGTGTGQCPIDQLGDFLGEGLLNKGTTLDVETDSLTEATFKALIVDGKLHQLLDREAFEQATPDNEIYTSPEGLIRSIRAGKPQFSITYSKGLCFHKALYKLQGNNKYDHIFYFTKGMLMATNVAGTKLKGFNGGEFMVGTYMFQQGTEIEKGKATFQLKDPEEFNTRWVFMPYDVLGFSPLEIDGVIETVIKIDPISAGTTITLDVVDGCNSSVSYADLFDIAGAYEVTKNGAEITPSAVSIVGGKVQFTVSALIATDVITIKLSGVQEDVNGLYYKSNTATKTVA
jgi:hypothetical protein